MEMEYKDPSRRGRYLVVFGVALAVVAGIAAFFLLNNAQQQAGHSDLKVITGVVAARPLVAKKALTADDIVVRTDIPLDATNSQTSLIPTSQSQLVGRLLGVDVAQGQLITLNLLASSSAGGQFSILGPNETVAPNSEAWRAVSITAPDDRAVGGLLTTGMTIDVIMTATVNPPASPPPSPAGSGAPAASAAPTPSPTGPVFISDPSTKVTYQEMKILARQGNLYVLKATLQVAEEITHVQASGGAQFSMVLRPDQDARILDVSALGATTNRIIQRYGLLIPEQYPVAGQHPSQPPIPAITPTPSEAPASPSPTPAP